MVANGFRAKQRFSNLVLIKHLNWLSVHYYCFAAGSEYWRGCVVEYRVAHVHLRLLLPFDFFSHLICLRFCSLAVSNTPFDLYALAFYIFLDWSCAWCHTAVKCVELKNLQLNSIISVMILTLRLHCVNTGILPLHFIWP